MSMRGPHRKRRYARLAGTLTATAMLTLALSTFAGSARAEGLLIGVVFPSQNQVRWAWEQKFFAAQAKANGDEVIFQFSKESVATQNLFESAYRAGARIGIGLSSASKPEMMPTRARRAAETSSRPPRSLARPPQWDSHPKLRSTTQRRASTTKPSARGRPRGGACRGGSTIHGSARP